MNLCFGPKPYQGRDWPLKIIKQKKRGKGALLKARAFSKGVWENPIPSPLFISSEQISELHAFTIFFCFSLRDENCYPFKGWNRIHHESEGGKKRLKWNSKKKKKKEKYSQSYLWPFVPYSESFQLWARNYLFSYSYVEFSTLLKYKQKLPKHSHIITVLREIKV